MLFRSHRYGSPIKGKACYSEKVELFTKTEEIEREKETGGREGVREKEREREREIWAGSSWSRILMLFLRLRKRRDKSSMDIKYKCIRVVWEKGRLVEL